AELAPVLAAACPRPVVAHVAFNGDRPVPAGDEGLWLAVNAAAAWRDSPVRGRPVAVDVVRLTAGHRPRPEAGQIAGHLRAGARCVAVLGPSGAGKSALLASLARPGLAPPRMLHALVLGGGTHTVEQVADELARQLRLTVSGFAHAAQSFVDTSAPLALQRMDALERAVLGPLRTLASPSPV